ncbi:MAG: hypothetical protein IJ087_04690, partial [Eggerthellaceae bacterium]|nr:hypothetical protein [Eggerthellaceae bacterium]
MGTKPRLHVAPYLNLKHVIAENGARPNGHFANRQNALEGKGRCKGSNQRPESLCVAGSVVQEVIIAMHLNKIRHRRLLTLNRCAHRRYSNPTWRLQHTRKGKGPDGCCKESAKPSVSASRTISQPDAVWLTFLWSFGLSCAQRFAPCLHRQNHASYAQKPDNANQSKNSALFAPAGIYLMGGKEMAKSLKNSKFFAGRTRSVVRHYKQAIGGPGAAVVLAVLALEALCFCADLLAFGLLFGQVMGDAKGMVAAGSISLLFPLVSYFGFRGLSSRFAEEERRERFTYMLLGAMGV